MDALAEFEGSGAASWTHADIIDAIGRSVAVQAKLECTPDLANIENCERSLKAAAQATMALWHKVQEEKQRRAEHDRLLARRLDRVADKFKRHKPQLEGAL